jgi:hypothetical protein
MGEWTEVKRDGEPVFVRGPVGRSVTMPNEYELRTTPLPAGAHGVDWRLLFNDQLQSPPITAYHEGNKITVACHPDHEPEWLEKVDAAIKYANERLKSH